MNNLILFPEKQEEDTVWTCECGCLTHYLHGNSDIECAGCGGIFEKDGGHWRQCLPDIPDNPELENDETFSRVDIDYGSIDLAIKQVQKIANRNDANVVVVVKKDGGVRIWIDNDVEYEPTKRLIDEIMDGAKSAGKFTTTC